MVIQIGTQQARDVHVDVDGFIIELHSLVVLLMRLFSRQDCPHQEHDDGGDDGPGGAPLAMEKANKFY